MNETADIEEPTDDGNEAGAEPSQIRVHPWLKQLRTSERWILETTTKNEDWSHHDVWWFPFRMHKGKMLTKSVLPSVLLFSLALTCIAQGQSKPKPIELEVLKAYIGVWDAEIEVRPDGPDSSSIQFKGVEKNRPYGEYWIASDFDSEFMGQTMKVHSMVGYDLDKKELVGTIIDHGPYAATMTGNYDKKSKTVSWKTEAKDLNGKLMLQKTSTTQKGPNERVLILMMPGKEGTDFTKFMQIRFVRQK